MSKKKVTTGWIGKGVKLKEVFEYNDFLIVNSVIKKNKKDKGYWGSLYPPRKVRITIEVI